MPGKILVLGATGHVGALLTTRLVLAKERVKAASRRASSVAGAEPIRFSRPSFFLPVRQGWTAGVTGDVQALTGKAPIPFEQYAADHAVIFAG